MRSSLHLVLLLSILLVAAPAYAAEGDTCSTSSQCDSSAPCCGPGNTCGSGSLFCAGSCQPLSSNKPTSCLPNPICQDTSVTFKPENYNDPSVFRPILQYNGDASLAPFTLDSGSLGKGSQGVLAQLTIDRQVKLSTTRYMLYGSVEAKIRSNVANGLVIAFIFMSDTKDEIDWEFTTADKASAKTNYFWQGISATADGSDVEQNGLDRTAWNTYALDWSADQLQWKINGQVVRTLKRTAAGSNGQYYPRSPSRVQLSMWAGGNSTNPQGVIDWSGGLTDWSSPTYTQNGYYSMELGSFSMKCSDPNANNLATTGPAGNNITSWVYTGQNSSEPEFQLSKNDISFLKNPAQGGVYGQPGYEDQTANTKSNSNMWDGSGDTGAHDKAAGGSDSSNSGGGGGITAASAKKYGIPIAAGVVGLIILWGLIVFCVRKQRQKRNLTSPSGVAGGGLSNLTSSNSQQQYKKLPNSTDYADSDDHLPLATEKQGTGIGPAVGPLPTSTNRRQEAYAMTPQPQQMQYNRVQTPAMHQQQGQGWGNGGGYQQQQTYQPRQQPQYSYGGGQQQSSMYANQQRAYGQPAWAHHQQYPQQQYSQQSYGTPRYQY
ncbi:unnamed protein product [Sympodiomycopsis kandeliae]